MCNRRRRILLAIFARVAVLAVSACSAIGSRAGEPAKTQDMVVSVSQPANDAGAAVLRKGGNAVDAAVSTALALAVTFPEAGNLGGGGFMLVWHGDATVPSFVDYRETAPAAAARNTFAGDTKQYGHKTVGVPGTLRGLKLAHHRFGKLPWRELVAPAIALAEEGFAVDLAVARGLNGQLKKPDVNAEFARVFARPGGGPWQPGDRLVQPDLAATLRAVAEQGADAFYRGPIAEKLLAEMRAGGGLIGRDDLAGYRAKLRTPLHGTYRGYDIYSSPPPSSGGTCLVEMLNILENFDLRQHGRFSPETSHLMLEAMRRAYCDRARHLGDPDFVVVPKHLTDKAYARKLAGEIDRNKATPSEQLAPEIEIDSESPSTTHFSIVDSSGMAVANTYTLQDSFGARVVVRGAGFLLNNEMTDFNWRPGRTDRAGAIGTEANTIEPGKRMLSSMSPTVVARNGKLVLVTGSPGGRTIPNTVLQVVLGVVEFNASVREAIDAPRWHQQWLPDRVRFEGLEKPEYRELVERLRAMGHRFDDGGPRVQGDAHSISIEEGRPVGGADRRRANVRPAP